MWSLCNGFQDTWEETWEEATRFVVAPIQTAVQEVRIEQIEGVVDSKCFSDCFQVFARVGDTRYERIIQEPSDAIMNRTKVAIQQLVNDDPLVQPPAWLAQSGFHEVDAALHDVTHSKIWYLNDRMGSKFFAAMHVPGKASRIATQIWKPAASRHINSVDEAPGVVVAELSCAARMEFHIMPLPHPMSPVVAKGMEFDKREALVLNQYRKIELKIRGQTVPAHLVWMKSVLHPDFPATGASAAHTTQAYSSRSTRGLPGNISRDRNVKRRKCDMMLGASGALNRAVIKTRGFLVFDEPNGGHACVIAFGNEDQGGSVLDFTGRFAGMVGLGNVIQGTTVKQVQHMLVRLQDVVMPMGMASGVEMAQRTGWGATELNSMGPGNYADHEPASPYGMAGPGYS